MHRDIKPQNIIYNEGKVKICDFNFSKNVMDNSITYTCLGSKKYYDP